MSPLITCTNVTSGFNDTDVPAGGAALSSPYVTASFFQEIGAVYLASCLTRHVGGASEQAVAFSTGLLTAYNQGRLTAGAENAAGTARIDIIVIVGDGRTDSITFFGTGTTVAWTNAHLSCVWVVDKITGLNGDSGNQGAVAKKGLGQFLGAAATSMTITLPAFANIQNATYGVLGMIINENVTPGSGFTEIADLGGSAPPSRLQTQFKNSNDTTVDWSWPTNNAGPCGIAAELIASRYPMAVLL